MEGLGQKECRVPETSDLTVLEQRLEELKRSIIVMAERTGHLRFGCLQMVPEPEPGKSEASQEPSSRLMKIAEDLFDTKKMVDNTISSVKRMIEITSQGKEKPLDRPSSS